MRYVLREFEAQARRLVNFDCGNISASGSVKGMQQLYGWPKGGQVRMGSYIYNVGPEAVKRLTHAKLLRGNT